MKYTRKIDTGIVATSNAWDVMHSVIGQMSDGIWENSNLMGYWYTADIDVSDHDTIVISLYDNQYFNYYGIKTNRWYRMSDSDVCRFFARKIVQICKEEQKYHDYSCALKLLNNNVSSYIDYGHGTTFGHAYGVRWALIGTADALESIESMEVENA